MKAKGKYTLDLYYDSLNPSESVTIEMGRFLDGISVIGERPDSNSAGFRYTIIDIENRHTFEDDYFYFFNEPSDDVDGKISLGMIDPNHIIT